MGPTLNLGDMTCVHVGTVLASGSIQLPQWPSAFCFPLSFSFSLFLSFVLSFSLSILFLSIYVCVSPFVCLCLSLCLSVSVCLSLCLSIFISVTVIGGDLGRTGGTSPNIWRSRPSVIGCVAKYELTNKVS